MSDREDPGDPGDPDESEPDQDSDWVDRLAGVAGALGMNKVRARWKLQRMQNRWRAWRRRTEQKAEHVRYAHKTCPHCGAVQDKDEKTCTSCGESLGARRWQVLRRLGLKSPVMASMSTLLGVSFVVIYGLMILKNGGGIMSLPAPFLYEWGGHFAPAIAEGEYWRWATACFLHAGLWHLGFNLFALAVIGPSVEELYGRFQLLFIFLLTGILANIGSGLMGLQGVGIGASGGLMGLVGLVAGWGHRQGSARGRAIRNDMLKWAAYVAVFGLVIGADNWAHGFGFLSGGLLGFAVDPKKLGAPSLKWLRTVIGLLGVAGCIATVALIVTGVPSDNRFAKSDKELVRERVQKIDAICARADRDPAAAQRDMEKLLKDAMPPEGVHIVCEEVARIRAECEQARKDGDPKARELECTAVLD